MFTKSWGKRVPNGRAECSIATCPCPGLVKVTAGDEAQLIMSVGGRKWCAPLDQISWPDTMEAFEHKQHDFVFDALPVTSVTHVLTPV